MIINKKATSIKIEVAFLVALGITYNFYFKIEIVNAPHLKRHPF